MPNRILRDWTDSDLVNQLTANAERFFVRLIMKVDDYGRQRAEPRMLRPLLYPLLLDHVREADLARWTAECEKATLVRLYVVEGKQYLEVVNFGQRLRNCTRSKFPDPPPGCGHTAESAIRLHSGTSGQVDNHPRAMPGNAGQCPPEAESEAEAHSETKAVGGRRSRDDPSAIPIPSELDTPDFRKAWSDFIAYRAGTKKALTDRAAELALSQLSEFGPAWAVNRINQAIVGGWRGLVFPEDRQRTGQPRNPRQAADDEKRQIIERLRTSA
jgi:hypothetical protein